MPRKDMSGEPSTVWLSLDPCIARVGPSLLEKLFEPLKSSASPAAEGLFICSEQAGTLGLLRHRCLVLGVESFERRYCAEPSAMTVAV